ncbi:MAG: dienelactone hydrolase family protein [Acidimicrobiia bacterium]
MLPHEGTYPIMYGSSPVPVGASQPTAYIARPDEEGRFPVVFVLPGLKGMTGFDKDLCRRLARAGFAALSIDFYRAGEEPLDSYNRLGDRNALGYIDELHDFVISDDVEWNSSQGVGLLGTDVGGRFALIAAATRNWVRSVVAVSAPLTGDEGRKHQVSDYLDHLRVPVLGLFGGEDDLIDATTVDEAQRRNDHGQWLLYEGAGHGFLDIDDPQYEAGAAEDAWARVLAFFQATLDKPVVIDLG